MMCCSSVALVGEAIEVIMEKCRLSLGLGRMANAFFLCPRLNFLPAGLKCFQYGNETTVRRAQPIFFIERDGFSDDYLNIFAKGSTKDIIKQHLSALYHQKSSRSLCIFFGVRDRYVCSTTFAPVDASFTDALASVIFHYYIATDISSLIILFVTSYQNHQQQQPCHLLHLLPSWLKPSVPHLQPTALPISFPTFSR